VEDYSYNKIMYALLKGEYKNNKRIGLWYEKRYD
jgi:hypothetical protein